MERLGTASASRAAFFGVRFFCLLFFCFSLIPYLKAEDRVPIPAKKVKKCNEALRSSGSKGPDRAQAFLQELIVRQLAAAAKALSEGNRIKAEALISRHINQIEVQRTAIRFGNILLKNGFARLAIQAFEKARKIAIGIGNETERDVFNVALAHFKNGDPASCLIVINDLLSRWPQVTEARGLKAKALIALKRPGEALEITKKLVAEDPKNKTAVALHIEGLIDFGDLHNAVKVADAYLSERDNSRIILGLKIRALTHLGDYDGVIETGKQLLRFDSKFAYYVKTSIVLTLLTLREYQLALDKLSDLGQSPFVLWLTARVQYGLKRKDLAKKILISLMQNQKRLNPIATTLLISINGTDNALAKALEDRFKNPAAWKTIKDDANALNIAFEKGSYWIGNLDPTGGFAPNRFWEGEHLIPRDRWTADMIRHPERVD